MLRISLLIAILLSIVIIGGSAVPFPAPTSLPVPPVTIHVTRATPVEHHTAWTVRCGYMISGMFCLTQRLILYIVAVCIFCFRFHLWLTAIGTAYIVTYTLTTAIYGFALAVDPSLGSDTDFVMIGRLLSISLFMAFLFGRFAPHMFKGNVTPALILWAGVTLTAFVAVAARDKTFYSQFYSVRAVEVCSSAGICVDTCSSVMPASRFRGPTDERMPLQSTKRLLSMPANDSLTINEFFEAAIDVKARLPSRGHSVDDSVDLKVLPFLTAWLLAILNWFSPPRNTRDNFFRAIVKKEKASDYMTWRSRPTKNVPLPTMPPLQIKATQGRKTPWNALAIRVGIAKASATICFIVTSLALLSFPGIFLWSIIQAEIDFRSSMFVEQEGPQNVGQWGSCVAVGLAATAAVVDRLSGRTSDDIDIWALHNVEKPPEAERPWWLFTWDEGWLWYVMNTEEWKVFVLWWKDPVRVCWPSV